MKKQLWIKKKRFNPDKDSWFTNKKLLTMGVIAALILSAFALYYSSADSNVESTASESTPSVIPLNRTHDFRILQEQFGGFQDQLGNIKKEIERLWGELGNLTMAGSDETSGSIDYDNDGYPASEDCNDMDSNIHPGAIERINGIDDDCDGKIDEGVEEEDDSWSWFWP